MAILSLILLGLCIFFLYRMRLFVSLAKITAEKKSLKDFLESIKQLLNLKIISLETESESFVVGDGPLTFSFENDGMKLKTNKKINSEILNLIFLRSSSLLSKVSMEKALESSAKLSALGEFSAGLAHEINNPLAVVHGKTHILLMLLEQLEQGENVKEDLKKTTNDVLSTIERIDKIISSLRYFVRDDKRNPLQNSNVQEVLDTVQILSIDRCRKENISLKIENQAQSLLYCKPTQISQVILNLISNSIDAISSSKEAKWISVLAKEKDGNIVFEVSDSGYGLSKEISTQLLSAFYTTKKFSKEGGMGLGLNISRRIVEAHFGTIALDPDRPNTTFVVSIPVQKKAA